jgi:hypothetical protein
VNEEEVRILLGIYLKARGITFYAERLLPNSRMRYDIGIHVAEKLIGLVEVKSAAHGVNHDLPRKAEQAKEYHKSGLPWIYCFGEADIEMVVQWAAKQWKNYAGKQPACDELFLAQLSTAALRNAGDAIAKRSRVNSDHLINREKRLAVHRVVAKQLGLADEPLPW